MRKKTDFQIDEIKGIIDTLTTTETKLRSNFPMEQFLIYWSIIKLDV